MSGVTLRRVYLDWNATAPLRAEAREAMLRAMDAVGNPSSVHGEGREAKAIIETARGQVARLLDVDRDHVVFTSGATEAMALVADGNEVATEIEHDCVLQHVDLAGRLAIGAQWFDISAEGRVSLTAAGLEGFDQHPSARICLQAANSETGVLQHGDALALAPDRLVCDAAQAVGRLAKDEIGVEADFTLVSGHKFGGPKGVGALIARRPIPTAPRLPGGGQEQGRRSGTENVIGIAGFGAAASAALRDLEQGLWDRVAELRNILESALEAAAPDVIFAGRGAGRLPNTTCFAVPGWRGETQVMQLDLAGFAVSAGSACSSGKVRESRVLRAMGWDGDAASSAIRVSLGPTTTEAEVRAFVEAWTGLYRRRRARQGTAAGRGWRAGQGDGHDRS
ncbi:MAG: cysteine desulfurase family protein [Pseudomonadota bacterium]